MAQPILQPGENFLNPYEKMYSILKNTNPHFDENIWNKVINGSSVGTDVNLYIDAIEKIKDLDAKALSDDYKLEYSDWNSKLMAQLNEAYKEQNLQNIQKRERYAKNEDGSIKMENYEPVTESYEINDYDYVKNMVREQGEIGYQNYLLQQEKERKESMSEFVKFLAGTAATSGHLVSGALKETEGIGNFFAGLVAGIDTAIKGGKFQKGMADYIVNRDASKEWGTQLEDLLIDFESRYTHLRDIDGNLTGAGKFFVSTADSFGQMIPSMVVTAVLSAATGPIGGVAGQVISKGIPIISQTLFYSGITANQTREMYQYYAQNGVTVPTEEILTNAEMKSVAQAGVEIMLSKLMGGSVLDNITYGRGMGRSFAGKSIAGKSLVGKGLARLAHDFIEEGSEEVLQEFSDYFVDKIWQSQYRNWGQFADITPENLGLSFVIGGISSFIGSSMRIISTPNMKVATSIDADGNVTYKNLGKGIAGKIASWEYGITLQEAMSNVNKIIEHRQSVFNALSKKVSSLKPGVASNELGQIGQVWSERDLKKANVALTQAYAAYRMLASIYKEVGPERFNAANDLLIFGSKNNNENFYRSSADKLMNSLQQLSATIPQKITTKRGKEKLVKVYAGEFRDLIIERRLGNINSVLTRDDETVTPSASELFESYPDVTTIIVTDNGTGAVETSDGIVIVPSAELNNAGASVVIADLSEQKLVNWVTEQLADDNNLLGIKQIKDWYKEIYNNEGTITDIVNKLCFDDKFYRVCLFKANRESLNFLSKVISQLSKIDVKSFADGVLKSKYEQMIKTMKSTLKQSLIYNFRADLQQIPDVILNQKDKKDIIRERWSQTLLYRIVNENDKLTEDDRKKIDLTVNSMVTLSDKQKQELKEKVFSVNPEDRVEAVNDIRGYFDTYRSLYDGTKYMPENSVPAIVFNYFLRSKGIFIDNISQEVNLTNSDIAYMKDHNMNVLQYRQYQFSEFCNNQYYFEFSTINPANIRQRNNISLYETNTRRLVGISNYISKMHVGIDIKKSVTSTITELTKEIHDTVFGFITNDLTDEQKQNVTMKDLIFDYGLLSNDVTVAMLQRFGLNSPKELTPQLKYTYFREYLPTVLDNVSINITPDGDIVFLNYKPYKQTFKTGYKLDKKDIKNGALLSTFFKQKYLTGKLADTVIKINNQRVKRMAYSATDNVIYVNSRYINGKNTSIAELEYAMAHELQHGIADVNGLNSGFTDSISEKIGNRRFLTTIISDIKTHVPELFRDTDKIKDKNQRWAAEKRMLDDFLYLCSGETLAYGQEFTDLVTFYPILIVKQENGRSTLVMPWGSKYDFREEKADVILQKKGNLIYNVLKTGTTELAKETYLSNPLISTFILNGNLYTADIIAYEEMTQKLKTYFHNLPDTNVENSIVSIKVENNTMRILADSSVLYSLDNKTSTVLYEIAQKAMRDGYEVSFQDKNRDDVSGTLEAEADITIESIADKIAMLYEQDIEDSQLSLDEFTTDDTAEEISVRIPTADLKPGRKRGKRKKDTPVESESMTNRGRYISDRQRETFESLKNVRTRQMSPELQKFYIGAEKNENIAPELRKEVMRGKLRWSSDKFGKMSVSYYFRTADEINDATFDLINDAFFKNKWIKSFTELETLIGQVSNIYAVYQMFADDKLTDVIENWTPEAVKRYIDLLNTQLGTKEGRANLERFNKLSNRYGDTLSKTYWREGGNEGYFRLNFMKYYDGTISSIYQFAKELIGINNSKWNTDIIQGQQSSAQNRRGDTNEIDVLENQAFKVDADLSGLSERLRDVLSDFMERSIPIKEYVDRIRVIHDRMVKYKLIEYLRKTGYPKTEEELLNVTKSLGILVYDEIAMSLEDSYNLDDTVNELEDKWVSFPDWVAYPKNFKYQAFDKELLKGKDKAKQIAEIEKYISTKFENWLNNVYDAILRKYNLSSTTVENQQTELTEQLLSGKKLREPANIVRSIKYYFRTIGPNLSSKEAALLSEQNPDLFTYNKDTGEFSINDDAYLTKIPGIKGDKIVYKLLPELRAIQSRIKNIAQGVKIGAYRSKKAMDAFTRSLNAMQKKIDRLTREANTIGRGRSQRIVTYNINEQEYSIEGDGDMPTVILDLMKNQNMGVDVRHSRVQILSDDDDAHIIASLKTFNAMNGEYLASLTQNDVEEIIGFYLTHAILSDKWSTDFETVRVGLLGYILRMSNALNNNPKFILSNDVIDKIYTLLEKQSSRGGQYLALHRNLLSQINPTKDYIDEMFSSYGFVISDDKKEELADAINSGDINRIGKIKSEITLDLLAQNRVAKNYNKFIKVLSKFVDKDMANEDYDNMLQAIDNKIEEESKYGTDSYIYTRLVDFKKAIQDKQNAGAKNIKVTDAMEKYFSRHPKLISEEYFNENTRTKDVFESYDEYKNAYYTHQIEKQATALNDYFNMKYKKTDTFLDKLWNFERAMMLTSPGTWVRNQVSDVVLHTTNRISDGLIVIGDKMFSKSKKWHKEGQYKIAGTKVINVDIKKFIDRLTDKKQVNNIFSQIDDAINKYDARKIIKNTPDMNLAELIVNKLAADISRGDIPFDKLGIKDERGKVEKAIAKSKKFLFKMLSDSTWIKVEFKRVLARMMTEENIDVALEGRSNEVQSMIAEAYTFAAQTYMHKSNFMNKFDDVIRKHAGSVGYFMWKQIFPFASASWNWFMEGLSYTPLGLAKGIVNLVKLDNTIQKLDAARQKGEPVVSSKFAEYLAKRQIGHGVIGTFGFIAGCLLAGFGKAGLDEEDGKYKLFVGDAMIDISDVFSTNGLLVGMSLVQACQQNSGDNWFENFMYIINTVMNQMVLESSFSDLFNTIRYNKNLGDFMTTMGIYTIPSMFIPNFLKSLSGLFGKYKVKYASGVVGKLERLGFQIAPYLALLDSVPKYIDPYTGEKQVALKLGWFNEDWLIPSILNKYGPIDVKPYNVSKYEKEAVELGIKKSMFTGNYKINGVDVNVSGKTLEALNKYYGELNQNQLQQLFDDQIRMKVQMSNGAYKELKYSQMTDKQKKNAIENIMEKNAKYSEIYTMTTKYDYKYFATEDEFKALRKLGITENVYRANNKYKGFIKK